MIISSVLIQIFSIASILRNKDQLRLSKVDDCQKITSVWDSENCLSVYEVNYVSVHQINYHQKRKEMNLENHTPLENANKATDIKTNGREYKVSEPKINRLILALYNSMIIE